MSERYLIGDRFVLRDVSKYFSFPWQLIDLKGELYAILGQFGLDPLGKFGYKSLAEVKYRTLEALLNTVVGIKSAYLDGVDLYWVLETRIGNFYNWLFVIKGDAITSYSFLTKGIPKTFYINHYGEVIKGSVVPSEKVYVKRKGEGIEIGFEEEGGVFLNYVPFGKKLTPLISGIAYGSEFVILPELNKAFNGIRVELKITGNGLMVYEIKGNGRVRVYMLMPEGEYLMYRHHRTLIPEIEKVSNVIIVKFRREVAEFIKQGILIHPDFNYLFIGYGYKDMVEASFDMENWITVEAKNVVYKKEKGSLEEVSDPFRYAKEVFLFEVEGKHNEYWENKGEEVSQQGWMRGI